MTKLEMKGSTVPAKRGWRGLVVAVLGLVILSMLVPLVFLLGLHNGFQSGYVTEYHNSASTTYFRTLDLLSRKSALNESEEEKVKPLNDLLRNLRPMLAKDGFESFMKETDSKINDSSDVNSIAELPGPPKQPGGLLLPNNLGSATHDKEQGENVGGKFVQATETAKGGRRNEVEKSCQLEFGSYCLWWEEHKEDMMDSMVKRLKDQLFVARAYYPSIAKLQALHKFGQQLKLNIQEFERILSETSTDADLPPHVDKKIEKMEAAIAKAKSYHVDCNNVHKKFRQILDLTKDEAHFHMKQSAFLYQLAVQTMPKSLHCLTMRLTVEYFRYHSADLDSSQPDKHDDPDLDHYVMFSNNLLASNVVINSTVSHAKNSEKLVFHVLTDGENYVAMKFWFSTNSYMGATIRVLNTEDLNLEYFTNPDMPRLSSSEEFRVSIQSINNPSGVRQRTNYISVFSHAHFQLPEIFPKLSKVVVLDDDVVVQRDLSPLWILDMEGKVNGAVEFCGVRVGQLKGGYLGEHGFDNNTCAWMSGLNVIDLEKWREKNLTEAYRRWLQLHEQQSRSKASFRAKALPASLITFRGTIYALDNSWVLSGLGYNYGIDPETIRNAAVLHYNGNMKPWLELGIPNYKKHWKKFLKRDNRFMEECNIDP